MYKNITEKPINLGIAYISEINNKPNDKPFEELSKIAENYRMKYRNINISEIPKVKYARDLFKVVGIDPTKHRPSSEALLRRAIKNKPLPKINPAVDIGNLCSLEFLLPICVYDADKIAGDIILRLGYQDESYLAINNRIINLADRYVLSDSRGAFGSPITDSQRSAVTKETKNLLNVIYFHADIPLNEKEKMLDLFIEKTIFYLSGKLKNKLII